MRTDSTDGKEPLAADIRTDHASVPEHRHELDTDQPVNEHTNSAEMASGSAKYLRYILFAFFVRRKTATVPGVPTLTYDRVLQYFTSSLPPPSQLPAYLGFQTTRQRPSQ